ncbi:SRPBCC family protein [Pelagicoccus enzymogenes]|uniref:SRPBCC family protein n=1 Tax=Pelagicoccus enzymogenes TaxID=2773457 RepID=UPI00280EB2DF|nr:SRPBCC family protein [Pelagicoccus enzymogenes]MDQ8199309.1 SRPBCC family protein [Pelagicoccus enzymogenes]
MKIVAKRDLKASPQELWAIVAQPGNMPAWNPKCVRASETPTTNAGETFTAVYEMKGQQHEAVGDILRSETNREITFRYNLKDSAGTGTIIETLSFAPKTDSITRVSHSVDFSKSNLPFWVKLLIGLIGRFGRNVGAEPLQGVQDLLGTVNKS